MTVHDGGDGDHDGGDGDHDGGDGDRDAVVVHREFSHCINDQD